MPSPIQNNDQGGKRPGQKYKSLLVWHYLQKHTDAEHAVSSENIKDFLSLYDITADRHSISRDIEALNDLFTCGYDHDLEESDRLDYEIVYDPSKQGYKLLSRPYEFEELRLLAECVRASKFISKTQEKHLLNTIESLCSEYQIDELKSEVYLIGRTKTPNKHVMRSLLAINQAIAANRKIEFKYLKYTLNDRSTQVERRGGKPYILSPFKLLINEGNYYLLAFSDRYHEMRTYRVDRMQDIRQMKNPREGENLFRAIHMETYIQRVFSMFDGEQKRVSIRFTNNLLDTAIERFGPGGETFYRADGPDNFIVNADVEISDQFYSWICGFRKRATILNPPEVVEGMKKFLSDIYTRYCKEGA